MIWFLVLNSYHLTRVRRQGSSKAYSNKPRDPDYHLQLIKKFGEWIEECIAPQLGVGLLQTSWNLVWSVEVEKDHPDLETLRQVR